MSRIFNNGRNRNDDYLTSLKSLLLTACNASTSCYSRSPESIRQFLREFIRQRDNAIFARNGCTESFGELDWRLMRFYSQSRKFITCDVTKPHSVATHLVYLREKAWPVLRYLKDVQHVPSPP